MSTSILDDLFAEKMEQRYTRGVEQGIAQGIEQGREEGIEQGRLEGERIMLRRVLTQRFGNIPTDLEERISRTDAQTLAALFDRALIVPSLDQM